MPLRLICLLTLMALTGCAGTTRSTYAAPQADIPPNWQYASPATAASPGEPTPWWQSFGDTNLDAAIESVLARNNDLAAATIKVRKAQLEAGIAADKLNPVAAGSVSHTNSRSLSGNSATAQSNSTALTLTYEIDLWGKLGSQRDVSKWEALATEQDKASTRLSLIGTTASLYWKLGYLNQRVALSEQSIAYAERTLQLVRQKYAAGSVTALDVLQAEQDLASQQASHTQLLQQRVEARASFALLFNGVPAGVTELAILPAHAMPQVDAGLPASVLARRPDLRAAELRLRESLATVDYTRTSYYPSLSLTGSLGTSSTALRDLLSNPLAALATELSLPFLQYREMQLKTRVSQADYDLAVVNFRQSLYAALNDVENALSARQQYARQGALLEKSLNAAGMAEKIYETRYRAGSVTLQTWLDAQEKRRTAEVSLAENRYNQLTAQVTLYQALGGSAHTGASDSDRNNGAGQ